MNNHRPLPQPAAFTLAVICAFLAAGALHGVAAGQIVSAPNEAAVRTPVRVDPYHPPKIGSQFYPPDSVHRHEEGKCVVRMEISPTGDVLAEQLLTSTGFPHLDSACVLAFLDGHLLPATLNGNPVTSWVNIPAVWKIGSTQFPVITDFSFTPKIADDYQLEVGREFYPEVALQKKLQGNCIVRALITENGIAVDISLKKSTGAATLDEACVLAIKHARYIPAKKDGVTTPAAIDILLDWRLSAPN